MPSETMVVDVTQDWAVACDVQERFMQNPGARIDALSYSARCRQVRALGGDCYDFMPLTEGRLAMAVADACGKGPMGFQASPFNRENPRAWFINLLVGVAHRGFALAFWTPPIFYLVRGLLSSSMNRLAYALLWSLGAVPFVLLHTTILWILIPPTDIALQNLGPRSLRSWVGMLRTSFADMVFIYVALVVAAHAYEYLRRVRTQERERYEYQQALAASELQVLKMQLHPHFLFNTLHGIARSSRAIPKSPRP
jgi:hypothetical protein